MIKKGDEIKLDIIELSSEGKGISRTDEGFVVFSEKTLPGDSAVLKIRKKKPNYAEATVVDVIQNSPFRVNPLCSYFGICGGCKIQNYDYQKQIEFKTNVVKDALERIGGFETAEVPRALSCDDVFFYRNKMEFSFSDDEWKSIPEPIKDENPFVLGLHVPKFHSKLIDIKECFLQSELSNNILNFTREFFKSRNISVYSTKTQSGFLRFLIIRQSRNTHDVMVNLITYKYDDELMKEYSGEVAKLFPAVTTVVNSVSQKLSQVAYGEEEIVLFGSGFITEKLKTSELSCREFRISPRSFFQTNTRQAERLFSAMMKMSDFNKSDTVLDLYCGTGTIAILIADSVSKVLGVELSEAAIDDALINTSLNEISNVEFLCADIKQFLESTGVKNYNKVIVDPPRSGLHPGICDVLSESDFEKIIYVSCNPHTQARDLKMICSVGKYRIKSIQPVDMFPHTFHVENIIVLAKE